MCTKEALAPHKKTTTQCPKRYNKVRFAQVGERSTLMCRVDSEKGRVISAVLALWAKWTTPDFGCVRSQLRWCWKWPSSRNSPHPFLGSSLSVKPWQKNIPQNMFLGRALWAFWGQGLTWVMLISVIEISKKLSVITHKVTTWQWIRRLTGVPAVGWEILPMGKINWQLE